MATTQVPAPHAPDAPVRDPASAVGATVAVHGVSKWFGTKVAVSDVSCSFGPGITGLLGPNGAGKTTLLRMITGLLHPSEGRVSVLGTDPRKDPAVYRRVGFVPEEDAVYGHLSARQLVRYAAELSRCDASARVVDKAIARVNLEDAADRPIAEYSKGMRQRAKVAAALVSEPDLLVLDEPLNGADPMQRAVLIGIFHELAAAGRTIIVSSHVLAEVERMTDRVIAILDGKLAAAGGIRAIRAAMTHIPHKVRIDADDPRILAKALVDLPAVVGVHFADGGLEVQTSNLAALGTALPAISIERSVRVTRFEPVDASLESVFRHLLSIRR
ncbi:MAG TPA: ABC transporter ATP-binding protein [Longimicrobiales bacterium]|nr:ABC transporter ATP-binding protein [Longimicrobiales bacterium]